VANVKQNRNNHEAQLTQTEITNIVNAIREVLLVRFERAEPTMKQTPTQIEQRQHINRACTLWALGWSASNGVEPTMKHNSDQSHHINHKLEM